MKHLTTLSIFLAVTFAASQNVNTPNIIKNTKFKSYSNVGILWELSFEVKSIKPTAGHTSVVHVAKQGGSNPSRLPGIWFNPSALSLHICSNVNKITNHCFNTAALIPCSFHSIRVRQYHHADGKIHYAIEVDGKEVYNIQNKKPVVSGNVHLWSGDPWYNAAHAHIRNIVFKKLEEGYPCVRNTLIRQKKILPKDFHLSFYIKPFGTVETWGSIVHATIGGDVAVYGDRIPGVWFLPGNNKLLVCSAISKNRNFCYRGGTEFSRTKYTHVAINQSRVTATTYTFTVHVDGKLVYNVLNNDARVFKNVKLYSGDPWYPAAKAYIKRITWLGYIAQ